MKTALAILLLAVTVCADDLFQNCAVEKIAEGLLFTEGPVWVAAQNALIFSDVRGDTLYRWTEQGGLEVFRRPSMQANGNTLDPQGRLITCRHQARDVIRTEAGGSLTVLAAAFDGGKLNSPNDVVVQTDGTVWFTDPPYGLQGRPKEQPFNAVFRLDPGATEPVPVSTNLSYPNGLAFSPDGKYLYVAESDNRIKPNFVMRYTATAEKTLTDGRKFAEVETGAADGLRVDQTGRLFCTSGLGVEVFDPDGRRLGVIRTPKPAANCCFGGPQDDILFITARDAVYRVLIGRGMPD